MPLWLRIWVISRSRTLPGSALEALKAHRLLRGPYVFCQADGQPHTNGTMKGPLERALRKADICREQAASDGTTYGTPTGAISRCVACRSRRSRN